MTVGHDRKQASEAETQDAMKPVSLPMPRVPARSPTADVAIDRAPTDENILSPQRPSMKGVDSTVIVDSLSALVEDIYKDVLIYSLEGMTSQLAEVQPAPEESEWALKLLGAAAEIVATATLTEVGGLAARAVGAAVPAISKAAADSASTLSKEGGKAAGAWFEGKLNNKPSSPPQAELESPIAPGKPLVDEFVSRERNALLARKHDAVNMLRVIKASAARQNPQALEQLDDDLRDALHRGKLQQWFQQKIAMEWSNFLARLSIGPRLQGQATNMAGANAIGGWHEAGAAGIAQWRGGHDGFLEITIDVASGSPILSAAQVDNHPGVGSVLRYMGNEEAPDGSKYTFGTLPMFRRVWLTTGSSKLESAPAFVITPEGALEVNYDDPLLAALGGAKLPETASAYDPMPEGQRSATAWSERGVRAAHAVAGARRIVTTQLSDPNNVRMLK